MTEHSKADQNQTGAPKSQNAWQTQTPEHVKPYVMRAARKSNPDHHSKTPEKPDPKIGVENLLMGAGPGAPLPPHMRDRLEPAFGGTDLSAIRVHKTNSVHGIDAQAATVGNHIYVQSSGSDMTSRAGVSRIAHEIEHRNQQMRGDVKGARAMSIDPSPALETAAQNVGDQIAAGQIVQAEPTNTIAALGPTSDSVVQRQRRGRRRRRRHKSVHSSRLDHIMSGHHHSSTKAGKSKFPAHWDRATIKRHVESIANDSTVEKKQYGYNQGKQAVRDGVNMRILYYPSDHPKYPNSISTAYPK